MFFHRFEFDMSAEDARRRELSVCVKNASSSFMNRDKDVIGQVGLHWFTSTVQEYTAKKSFSYSIFLFRYPFNMSNHSNDKINE